MTIRNQLFSSRPGIVCVYVCSYVPLTLLHESLALLLCEPRLEGSVHVAIDVRGSRTYHSKVSRLT